MATISMSETDTKSVFKDRALKYENANYALKSGIIVH